MEEEARYRNYILDKVKYSFSLCEDAGGSDDIKLNVENIAPLLTSLGVHQGESDILDLTRNALVEANGAIDPIDLDKALVRIAAENGDHEELYFDEAFAILDQDNDGYITCADIYRLFQKLEVSISDQELLALVNNIDLDQDGKIGFEDFRDFMVCLKPQLPEPEIRKASSDGNDDDDDGDDEFEEKKQEDNEDDDSKFGTYKRLRRPSSRKLTREDSQYHLVSEQKRKLLSYVDYVKDAVSVISHMRRGSQVSKAEVVQNPQCEGEEVYANDRTKGVSLKTSEIHERLTKIFQQNLVSSERTERVVTNKNTNEAPENELSQNNSRLEAIVTTEPPEDMHSDEDTHIEDISDISLDVDTNITVEQLLGNIDVFSNSSRKQRGDGDTQHELQYPVLETEHSSSERELDTASESSVKSLPSHVDLCDYFDPDNMSTSSKNKLFNLHKDTTFLNTDSKGQQYEKRIATEAGKLTSMTISPFQLTPRATKAKVTDLVSMFPTLKTEHARSYTGDNLRPNSPIENVQKHLEDNVDVSSNMNNHGMIDCLVVRSCQKSKIPKTQKNDANSIVDNNLTALDFDIPHSRNQMYDFDEIEASEFPEPVEDEKLNRILRAARLENFITGGFSNNVDMSADGLNKNYGFVQIENFEMPFLSTPRTSRVQTAKTKDKQRIVPIRPKTATSATFTPEPSLEPRDYIIGDALTARHLTTSRLHKSKLRQSLESHNTQDSGYVVGRTWYEQLQSSGDGPATSSSSRRLSTWQHTFQKAAELSHPQTAESRIVEPKRPNTTDSGIASQTSHQKSTDTRLAHVSKINAPRKVKDFESERRTGSGISSSLAETKSLAYTENEEDRGYSTTNDYRDSRQNHVLHDDDTHHADDLSHKEDSQNSSHYSDTGSKNDTEMFPNDHNRKSTEHVHNPLSTCCGCSLERLQTLYATLNCPAPPYKYTKVVHQGGIPDRPKTAHASLDAPDPGYDHIRFQGDHRRRPKTANFIAMTKIEEGPTDSTEPQRINIRFNKIDLPDTSKDIYTSIADAKIKTSVDTKAPFPKPQTRRTSTQITTVQLNIDFMDKRKNDNFIPFLKRPKTSPGRVSFVESTSSNQKDCLNSPPIRRTTQRLARSKSDVCNRLNADGTHNIYNDNFPHHTRSKEPQKQSKSNLSRSKSARNSSSASQIVRVVNLSASAEIEQGFQVSESYSSFKPLSRPFSSMRPRKSKVVENSSLSRSLQTRGILIQHDDLETCRRRPIQEVETLKVIEPVMKSKHVITLELPRT